MASRRAQASPTYALSVSADANRSNASTLQGAAVSGSVYVFTSYASNLQNYRPTGISRVCYWLDNPSMTSTAVHCESILPFDFAGTAGDGTAYRWGTTSVANGTHTITQLVTLSGGGSEVDSATFSVDASVAPSITSQPANQTVTAGQTASFSVAATGTAPLSYQWRKYNVAISGATSSSFTTPATTSSDNGAQFTVLVSNTAGSVTSNAATLTVNAAQPPSVAISSPANGGTVSGTITVSGTASDAVGLSSVQLQIDGGAFSSASGTTNWTFSLNSTSLSNAAHTLTARATDSSGLSASSSVSVNVSNSSGSTVNVTSYGATGNGSTDDTAAVNSAIAALQPGDTLLFPCTSSSTYLLSSQLTLNISNVTVDGSSCAILHNLSSGAVMVIGGSGDGNPNYGSAVALSSTANELATTFTTVSSLGVAPGDYLLLQQGGKDSSTGSGDTGCDPSGCRGELLKVASVSGNSITVTTALHDTYNPSLNAATAQKILSPLTGVTVKNITFDGNGSNVYGLELAGVAESSVTGVTSRNVQGAALLNRGDFNVSWSNITVTGAGSAQCGSAVWFEKQGNLSITGLSISNENQGASGTGCLYNGAFGFELQASANSTITNLSVDAAGAYGRPFKTSAARYNTFNSPIVKNGVQAYNGISLEYYSSHNTFNSCVVTNNGANTGTGTGNAGIITFGNFNQFNSFNNCTVSGNGNIQFYISGYDALRLAADSHNTVSGGTFTGSNNVEAPILIEGDGAYITGATISGPGAQGIYLDNQATNACVNNNTFTLLSGLGSAISANSSNDMGFGNLLNLLASDLTAGNCAAPLP
jgi:Big-like domain-containing protein/pectate lyase-like protein/immunoglobulin I-set domain protein